MLKVNPVLNCKHHVYCISKRETGMLGVIVCKLNYEECKGLPCEHYINKYKEWEEQRDKQRKDERADR